MVFGSALFLLLLQLPLVLVAAAAKLFILRLFVALRFLAVVLCAH